MSKGDAVRREDGYGDGDERNSSGDVDSMCRGKCGGGGGGGGGGGSWIVGQGQ